MRPIPVDILDAMPKSLTVTVPVSLRNLWRVRLAMFFIRVAGRLMRSEVFIEVDTKVEDRTRREE